jgi:hypothetical protein
MCCVSSHDNSTTCTLYNIYSWMKNNNYFEINQQEVSIYIWTLTPHTHPNCLMLVDVLQASNHHEQATYTSNDTHNWLIKHFHLEINGEEFSKIL